MLILNSGWQKPVWRPPNGFGGSPGEGLVSRETSYVAVEERAIPETGEMTLKKVPLAEVEKALAGMPDGPALLRRAAATALALFWLEWNAPDQKDEWRLLARKARAWLNGSGALPPGGGLWDGFADALLGSSPGV